MTKRKHDEGRAPHAKNPHAVALGELSFKAKFAGMTPKEVSAEQARRSRCQRFTPEKQAAIRAKKQATWRAKRIAFLEAEGRYAEAEALEEAVECRRLRAENAERAAARVAEDARQEQREGHSDPYDLQADAREDLHKRVEVLTEELAHQRAQADAEGLPKPKAGRTTDAS